ncbi:MAG TPA: ATP-binding protein, partial [Polyangiaceae bacterium]
MRAVVKAFVQAAAAVAIATAIKLVVGNWLAQDPDALFLAAVALTAWWAGARAGIVAVLLASIAQTVLFLPRVGLLLTNPEDMFGLLCWLAEGALVCWVIEARQRANAQREDLERRVFHSNPVPMFVFDDKSLRFVAVNEAALALYGYSREELFGMQVLELHPQENRASAEALIRKHVTSHEEGYTGKVHHRTKSGAFVDLEIFSCTTNFEGKRGRLATLVNRTEEAKLETQLRHAQKMDAIGSLAGGVAHDFNNMLSVMLGYAVTALEDMTPEDPHYEAFEQIQHAAERSAELTQKLLALGRRQPVSPKRVDLNVVVRDAQKLLRRLVGSNIQLNADLASAPLPVDVDAGQVEQVIMNLVVNARDAIEGARGKISIASSELDVDAALAAKRVGLKVGRSAVIAITDDGSGMDEATQARIFEPFFTTKDQGKGTGLGLAIAFGIVEQNGGHIEVESELGVGTTMKLYFRLSDDQPTSRRAASREVIREGSETVLVVDDEMQVLQLVASLLTQAGYEVISASHPVDAIAKAAAHEGPIDLLLTDVIMPEMSGVEVALAIKRRRPAVKVVYM